MDIHEKLKEFVMGEEILQLFESTRGILFFIKDNESRILAGNQLMAEHLGFLRAEQLCGKSDFDIFPAELAQRYREDDRQVIASGKGTQNIVELFPNFLGELSWFSTCKIPLFNATGEVQALCGILQAYEDSSRHTRPFDDISKALDFIKDNYSQKISNKQLAQLCCLSLRQFENRFKEILATTPHKYIIRLRVLKSRELLLKRNTSITDVALQLGFCDQSAFTAHFRKQFGQSPMQYIRKSTK